MREAIKAIMAAPVAHARQHGMGGAPWRLPPPPGVGVKKSDAGSFRRPETLTTGRKLPVGEHFSARKTSPPVRPGDGFFREIKDLRANTAGRRGASSRFLRAVERF